MNDPFYEPFPSSRWNFHNSFFPLFGKYFHTRPSTFPQRHHRRTYTYPPMEQQAYSDPGYYADQDDVHGYSSPHLSDMDFDPYERTPMSEYEEMSNQRRYRSIPRRRGIFKKMFRDTFMDYGDRTRGRKQRYGRESRAAGERRRRNSGDRGRTEYREDRSSAFMPMATEDEQFERTDMNEELERRWRELEKREESVLKREAELREQQHELERKNHQLEEDKEIFYSEVDAFRASKDTHSGQNMPHRTSNTLDDDDPTRYWSDATWTFPDDDADINIDEDEDDHHHHHHSYFTNDAHYRFHPQPQRARNTTPSHVPHTTTTAHLTSLKAAFDKYNTTWQTTPPSSPIIPFPTLTLTHAPLLLHTNNPTTHPPLLSFPPGSIPPDRLLRLHACSFIITGLSLPLTIEIEDLVGPRGSMVWRVRLNGASAEELGRLRRQLRREAGRWHPDRGVLRGCGEGGEEWGVRKEVFFAWTEFLERVEEVVGEERGGD